MRLILLICTVLLLAGCGKKGALYLPDSAPPASTQAESQ